MKKIVVIGGGFAGSYIARELQKDFNVVLIDRKDYFEFTPGILRCLVEPEHLKNIQVMHKDYFKGQVIVGDVTKVFPDYVVVDGEKIYYDYLVICSGSRYSMPFKEEDVAIAGRGEDVVRYYEKLGHARKVLIIGGGIVGVELAGEILWKYPGKKVVLVHSHDRLIQRCNNSASRYAGDYLRKRGVEIIFNERVVSRKKNIFLTNKKREIDAELVFLCTGIKANSELLNGFKGVHDKEYVKVNEHLQLLGYDNIFVAGDVNNIREEKLAQNAEEQAKIVIENINNLEGGKPLVGYKSKPRIMVISLGKNFGLLVYKDFTFRGRIPCMIKRWVEKRVMKRY